MARKTYSKEISFIRNLYSDTVSRQTKPTRREKVVDVEMNVDEFVQHWKNQKKRFGLKCPYTYKTMTTIHRGKFGGKARAKFKKNSRIGTNVSVDQIYPGKGYTFLNTIFISNEANSAKKGVTPDMAQAIIDTYDERTRLWMQRLNKPKTKRQKQRAKLKNIRQVILETAYEMAKFNTIDGVQLSPEQRSRYEDSILRMYINNLDKLKKLGTERMVNYYEVE